eukprot:1158316-Pelagomonas_calceolata.AAC.3
MQHTCTCTRTCTHRFNASKPKQHPTPTAASLLLGSGSPCSCVASPPPSPKALSTLTSPSSSHPSYGSSSCLYAHTFSFFNLRCPSLVLPGSSLAAFGRHVAGLPGAFKGKGAAALCLATYLRTTYDGRGVWLGIIQRPKRGKGAVLISGKRLPLALTLMGLVMVMVWVASFTVWMSATNL